MTKNSSGTEAKAIDRRKADEIDRYVGQQIRNRRIEMGLSQQALAEHLAVTYQQIQKYESAHNRIAPGKLFAISEIYNVDIGFFFPPRDWLNAQASAEHLSQKQRRQRQDAHNLLDEILTLQQHR